MQSDNMKAALTHPVEVSEKKSVSSSACKGYNSMKALVSDVGDVQKTSDKLMFALISIKFPTKYDEDL